MTPAEVIAMRDALIRKLVNEVKLKFLEARVVADVLIRDGWVVAPPKNEGENSEQHCDGA